VQAKYSALKTLAAARQDGGDHLEIRTQCVASRLVIDPASGRITSVEYKRYAAPGAPDHVTEVVQGKLVVLAANAIENTVLALASGIVDRSGQLGRNLMDHPYVTLNGFAPRPVYPLRGPDITSGIESLRDGRFREKHAAFRASIANWGWIGEPAGAIADLLRGARFGKKFREELRGKMTRMVRLGVFLEQLPDANNRVTIDPRHTDTLGGFLPVLNYRYDDYSLDGALAAIGTLWPAVLDKTGIEDATDFRTVPRGFQQVTHRGQTFNIMGPGHIVGTHRMGHGASSSVVDPDLRSWAHKNLFMLGAGSMVTIGTGNPTLTAAALSLRAAQQILRDLE
jgi:choline dehydrogenase-like flavoprotein